MFLSLLLRICKLYALNPEELDVPHKFTDPYEISFFCICIPRTKSLKFINELLYNIEQEKEKKSTYHYRYYRNAYQNILNECDFRVWLRDFLEYAIKGNQEFDLDEFNKLRCHMNVFATEFCSSKLNEDLPIFQGDTNYRIPRNKDIIKFISLLKNKVTEFSQEINQLIPDFFLIKNEIDLHNEYASFFIEKIMNVLTEKLSEENLYASKELYRDTSDYKSESRFHPFKNALRSPRLFYDGKIGITKYRFKSKSRIKNINKLYPNDIENLIDRKRRENFIQWKNEISLSRSNNNLKLNKNSKTSYMEDQVCIFGFLKKEDTLFLADKNINNFLDTYQNDSTNDLSFILKIDINSIVKEFKTASGVIYFPEMSYESKIFPDNYFLKTNRIFSRPYTKKIENCKVMSKTKNGVSIKEKLSFSMAESGNKKQEIEIDIENIQNEAKLITINFKNQKACGLRKIYNNDLAFKNFKIISKIENSLQFITIYNLDILYPSFTNHEERDQFVLKKKSFEIDYEFFKNPVISNEIYRKILNDLKIVLDNNTATYKISTKEGKYNKFLLDHDFIDTFDSEKFQRNGFLSMSCLIGHMNNSLKYLMTDNVINRIKIICHLDGKNEKSKILCVEYSIVEDYDFSKFYFKSIYYFYSRILTLTSQQKRIYPFCAYIQEYLKKNIDEEFKLNNEAIKEIYRLFHLKRNFFVTTDVLFKTFLEALTKKFKIILKKINDRCSFNIDHGYQIIYHEVMALYKDYSEEMKPYIRIWEYNIKKMSLEMRVSYSRFNDSSSTIAEILLKKFSDLK